jgi:hypothetical protein
MLAYHETLYSKGQAEKIMAAMGVTESLPGKGRSLWISQPYSDAVEITKTTHKGTDGRLLYSFKLYR